MGKFIYILFALVLVNCSNNKALNQEAYSYNRDVTLKKIELILNKSAPEYQEIVDKGFSNIEDGVPIGYFVFDLSNPSNRSKKVPEDVNKGIEFIEGHFYHFSPVIMSMSYSHIAYLEKGNMIVFKYINCIDRGDSIEDVLTFANEKLKNNSKKQDIMGRLKKYRQYGIYHIEDNYGMRVNCKCSPCE